LSRNGVVFQSVLGPLEREPGVLQRDGQTLQRALSGGPAQAYQGGTRSNLASCRVLEKAGFRYEGTLRSNAVKNGEVRDMKIYSLLKTER